MNFSDELTQEHTVADDAHAVLMPMVDALHIEPWLASFLAAGGCSVLMALPAEEYNTRQISATRRATEDTAAIQDFTAAVQDAAGTAVVIGIDAEVGGVHRLQHLLPPLPARSDISSLSDAALFDAFHKHAHAARALGVSLFLGPVLDMVTGSNAWLDGRMMIEDFTRTSAVGVLYSEAVQAAGIIATAKHFPGHPHLAGHPGHDVVRLDINQEEVLANIAPFVDAGAAGVQAVMLGPVVVDAVDPDSPAATSKLVVDLLRVEVGFSGLIISDDLDLPSTMVGRPLGEVAVESLRAGVQLLLVTGGQAVAQIATELQSAVASGVLPRSALARAADAVRKLTYRAAVPAGAGPATAAEPITTDGQNPGGRAPTTRPTRLRRVI